MSTSLDSLVEESLRFEWFEGGVSHVTTQYTTGWRSLPYAVVCQWQEARCVYTQEDGVIIQLGSGEGLLIPPGIRHRVDTLTETAVCRWAHVRFTALGSVSLMSFLTQAQTVSPACGDQIGTLCEQLASLSGDGSAVHGLGAIARRKCLGFQILALICDHTPLQVRTEEFFRHTTRLVPVLRYIQSHLSTPMSREDLASRAGLSPTHFHVLFKEATGMAPMDYVRRLRLEEAQRLLVETDLSIAEVGERVGFCDPFHFSRRFRKFAHISPIQYRSETRASLFSVG